MNNETRIPASSVPNRMTPNQRAAMLQAKLGKRPPIHVACEFAFRLACAVGTILLWVFAAIGFMHFISGVVELTCP